MQLVICTKYIFAQNKYKSDTKEHLDLIKIMNNYINS